MADVCFVLAPGQNDFFFELADVLRHELEAVGATTRLTTDGFPRPGEDGAYALLPPHEYFALEGGRRPPPPEALRRTIMICAEQPDTIHFRQNLALAASGGALFDINERAVRAYRRRGIRAEHLRLGYAPSWDRFHTAEAHTDVIFLGAHTPRRGAILAGMAEDLARLDATLVLSDNSRPNPGGSATFLAGAQKWDALSAARILLNIHQGSEPYFEWHRILQAIHCGAAVVTEESSDFAPLAPGDDFEMCSAPDLAGSLRDLAGDDERRRGMAGHAYERIRAELPMGEAAERLAAVAGELASGGGRGAGPVGRVASQAAAARLRLSARTQGRNRSRRSVETLRRQRSRTQPAGAAPPDAEDLHLSGVEGAPGLALITADGSTLLDGALARLREALEGSGAAFAYGLVAIGEGEARLVNVLGPDSTHPPSPPVLLRRDALDGLPDARNPAAVLTALAASSKGVAVRQFVARAGEHG